MAVKKKKKLDKEWKDRKVRFLLNGEQKYILHAWNYWECDDHGDDITHSHSYNKDYNGWEQLQKRARKYADAGYTVSITSTRRK